MAYTLGMSGKGLVAAHWYGSDQVLRDMAVTWARTLCQRCDVRVRGIGVDRVDWSQPLVVGSNHQSLFDVPCIVAALGRAFGFVAKKELFLIPLFGHAMKRAGCVFIDRGDPESAHQSITRAAQSVATGASIVVFPEGTRASAGRLGPFKKGPFYLVQAAQVPLVPIGVVGTAGVLSRDGVLVHGGDVQVRVGEPLRCQDDSAEARDALRAELRESIRELTGFADE